MECSLRIFQFWTHSASADPGCNLTTFCTLPKRWACLQQSCEIERIPNKASAIFVHSIGHMLITVETENDVGNQGDERRKENYRSLRATQIEFAYRAFMKTPPSFDNTISASTKFQDKQKAFRGLSVWLAHILHASPSITAPPSEPNADFFRKHLDSRLTEGTLMTRRELVTWSCRDRQQKAGRPKASSNTCHWSYSNENLSYAARVYCFLLVLRNAEIYATENLKFNPSDCK